MAPQALRCLVVSLVLTTTPAARAAEPWRDDFDALFRPFLARYCSACHGPDVQERGLRFDQLPSEFGDKDIAGTWVKVLDRLSHGEMPPKDEPRPNENDARSVVTELQRQLHQASLAKQRREGRVALRRLNRTEYQMTLADLLGTTAKVEDLLPDDNLAAGFDKLSAVLDVSSAHLLGYQAAAEKALASVVPKRPPASFENRRTGRGIVENVQLPHFRELIGKSVRLDGDTLVMFVRPWGHIPCATAPAPQSGQGTRVRLSAFAVGTGGKSLPLLCSCRDLFAREDDDVRAVRDVPADEPTVIEGEFDLRERQMIVFTGWSLPTVPKFAPLGDGMSLGDYTGPGMAIEWVEIKGPLDPWPPKGYQRLFGGVRLTPKSEAKGRPVRTPAARRPDNWWIYDPLIAASSKPREDSERLMRSFLPRAFRRPVSEELRRYYVNIVRAAIDKGLSFQDAMLLGYKAALCSPHFLYLTEPDTAAPSDPVAIDQPAAGPIALDGYAVAARLSYFLWSSMPDDKLVALAADGELTRPAVLRAQVERLLADPKARRFTANFAGQWLDLRKINATSPDPQIYGEFDDFLYWSMPRETEAFFEEVLRADLSLTEFVHSDWTFLNERLARHYGIAGVVGGELRKVRLPMGCHRGGILTHASTMKVTADGTRTSPVLRGKWVLDRILGQPPSPPPPDLPAIEPDIRGTTTIRQQLDRHRDTAACATCHRHIDPPGFALESFDVIGGWRDFYRGTQRGPAGEVELANYPGRRIFRGLDVEQGGETPDGRPFKDIDEYKQILLADKDQLARSLTRKLLIYATGAEIEFADREVVEQLVERSRAKNYGFRSLVHDVVQSRVFLSK